MQICKVETCKIIADRKDLCSKHYTQMYRYGKILERTRYTPNEFIEHKNFYEICLYKDGIEICRAKISKEDYVKVINYKWHFHEGYVRTERNHRVIFLHILILGKKKGFVIDHKDTDRLNNQRDNLRFATKSQNGQNRKCLGVYWCNRSKRWLAVIKINYKRIYLGAYKNKQEAVIARKDAEKKYFGEFAFQVDKRSVKGQ